MLQERIAAERRQQLIAEIFDRSGVPKDFREYTLDSYPDDGSTDAIRRVRDYVNNQTGSIYLWGPVGRGKTGVASALMNAIIEREASDALFTTALDLWDEIRATYGRERDGENDGEYPAKQLLDLAKQVSLLVIDDLGAERGTEWEQERLFAIVNARRNEQLRTIFTSNLGLYEVAEKLGERTARRIAHMCTGHIIEFTGPNLL